jgi:O-methyltransferase
MTADLYEMPRTVSSMTECDFYHAMEIPGDGVVEGQWDLREGVGVYLGSHDFDGQRVIEIGPATGFLTFHMESRGAEVVAVDLPMDDSFWDFVPYHHLGLADRDKRDESSVQQGFKEHIGRIRNGFWYAHEKFESKSKVHYGSPYDLPAELGRFDTAVMCAVLLHTQSPVRTIESCARLVTDTIIITEMHDPSLGDAPVCRLAPTVESETWDTWWTFSPRFFQQYLAVLGFGEQEVTFHKQLAHGNVHDMYTVVASRGA